MVGTSKLEYHYCAAQTDESLIILENHRTFCHRNVGEALSFLRQHEGEDQPRIRNHMDAGHISIMYDTYIYYVSANCSINV